MLRIGYKYQLRRIQREALRQLEQCFPDVDNSSVENYLTWDTERGLDTHHYFANSSTKLERRDAIAVINMARWYHLDNLLPTAFYVCTQLPTMCLSLVTLTTTAPTGSSRTLTWRLAWTEKRSCARPSHAGYCGALVNTLAEIPTNARRQCVTTWHSCGANSTISVLR